MLPEIRHRSSHFYNGKSPGSRIQIPLSAGGIRSAHSPGLYTLDYEN